MTGAKTNPVPSTARAEHEIAHGRFLASSGAEAIWGWSTPAGQLRALRRADMIARGADLHAGMNVLEVGCGTGLFTELLSKSGANLIAVDISPELLEQAGQRGLDPAKVKFVPARFEDCALYGPFDAVVGSSVLHHLEIEPSLRKIFDLLKPAGVMSFAEPNMLNPQIAIQKNIGWIKRRLGDSPDETAFVRWRLAKLLKRIAFEQIRITPFDWLHPVAPRLMIPTVRAIGAVMERIPVGREFAGSVHIRAVRPMEKRI
jgi:2-polyprenyl-3-methyl-5-hydroxy-6-metoxy-1,4-benzoquinol methylase